MQLSRPVDLKPLAPSPGPGVLHAPWLAARSAAVLSLAAAYVHLAYMPSHFEEWWLYGMFFLAVGVGQALFVPAILYRPRTWVVLVGIAGNLGVVCMYVVSRTVGIPLGPHARVVEHAEPIDLATTGAEVALIGVLLVMLGRGARRWIVNGLLAVGALLWVLRLTGHLP
jgi:hypothetical protein